MANRTPALWQRKLRPVQHQILWFLIDINSMGKLLCPGWQVEAARQLGIHRVTLYRQIRNLARMGIMVEGVQKGSFMLNLKSFGARADRSRIKMMPASKRMIKK